MDQSPVVGGLKGVGDLGADPRRPFGRQGSFRRQERPEVGALDEAHREVELAVGLPGRVHGHDVGVLGRGGGVGLVDEPFAEGRIGGELGGQELQRDLTFGVRLVSEVDDPHPAAPDLRLDAEAGDLPALIPPHQAFLHPHKARRATPPVHRFAHLDGRLAVRHELLGRLGGRTCAERSGRAPTMRPLQSHSERRHRRLPRFEWTASEWPQLAQKALVELLREGARGSTCVMRGP